MGSQESQGDGGGRGGRQRKRATVTRPAGARARLLAHNWRVSEACCPMFCAVHSLAPPTSRLLAQPAIAPPTASQTRQLVTMPHHRPVKPRSSCTISSSTSDAPNELQGPGKSQDRGSGEGAAQLVHTAASWLRLAPVAVRAALTRQPRPRAAGGAFRRTGPCPLPTLGPTRPSWPLAGPSAALLLECELCLSSLARLRPCVCLGARAKPMCCSVLHVCRVWGDVHRGHACRDGVRSPVGPAHRTRSVLPRGFGPSRRSPALRGCGLFMSATAVHFTAATPPRPSRLSSPGGRGTTTSA